MKRFKVICPQGVSINGDFHKPGAEITGDTRTAGVRAALHFRQIEPIEEEPKAPKEPEKEPEKAEAPKAKEPKAPKEPEKEPEKTEASKAKEPKAPKEPAK